MVYRVQSSLKWTRSSCREGRGVGYRTRSASAQRVLLVEDDAVLRRLMVRLLRLEGHEVEEGRDGVEALEVLDRVRIDLLITDLQMPRMDGGELIRIMSQVYPEIPVIIMSGECDVWDRFHLHDCPNIHRLLVKPVTVETLMSEVSLVLQASSPAQ